MELYLRNVVMPHVCQLALQNLDNELNTYVINNLAGSLAVLGSTIKALTLENQKLKEQINNPPPTKEEKALAKISIIEAAHVYCQRTGRPFEQGANVMEKYW